MGQAVTRRGRVRGGSRGGGEGSRRCHTWNARRSVSSPYNLTGVADRPTILASLPPAWCVARIGRGGHRGEPQHSTSQQRHDTTRTM